MRGLGAVVVLLLACTARPKVEKLYVNAFIHTPKGVVFGGVAVNKGEIVGIFPQTQVNPGSAQEVVDLQRAHVFPGFTESHGHLLGYGKALLSVDLTGVASYQELVDRVVKRAATVPKGQWITGRGWDQNLWPEKQFPHHQELSQQVPHHPVLLRRVDGHAALVNAVALELAGITETSADPPGGKILRDSRGQPTGVLIDRAVELVERVLPPPSPEELRGQLRQAQLALVRFGITEIHDAGVGAGELEVLRDMARQGELIIRIYAMLDGSDPDLLRREFSRGPEELPGDVPGGLLRVRAVKLYADGALGSRGALLSRPYNDAPATSGLALTSKEKLAEVVRQAALAGFQPCIHAIGDAAVTEVLDLYGQVLGERARELRPRVEHAQIVRPEDVPRFAELGVIASVQPTHCTSDMPWAPARLGEDRIAWAYRWRSLLEAGSKLCLGSDVPVESPDPRLGLWAAVTRQLPSGYPAGGWNPEETLTLTQAVAGYTEWAAWAAFEEGKRGKIASGFLADFTIFDRDVSRAKEEILPAKVVRTVVAGRDVYVAGSVP